MSGSSEVLAAGLRSTQEGLTARSANLTRPRTPGDKGQRVEFLPGIGGTSAGGSAASVRVSQEISKHGAIVATGNETDFAIDGDGMLMVKKDGAIKMTTLKSFRYAENTRTLTNGAGGVLQVVELVDGKLPQNYNSVNSLVDASFRNIASSAAATKTILVAANLDANGDLMDGPGRVINYSIARAAQENNKADIVTPGENDQGSLYFGNTISLLSKVPDKADATTASKFQFGGIAASKKPTATNPIYEATEAGGDFSIASGVSTNPKMLSLNQGIRITAGGIAYEFTASPDGNKEANNQFNSLISLCKSINDTTGGQIRATIGSDGRLYIAAKDADSGISFTDINAPGGWAGMVDTLGLINVQVNDPTASGFTRYASNLELSTKINKVPTLSARFEGNNLRFGSAAATSTLTVGASSPRTRSFQRVTSGYQPSTGVATDSIKRRTVSITSPAHGLKIGDWVRISGVGNLVGPVGAPMANALQDGVYRVDAITDDTFAVATKRDLVAHGDGGGGVNAPPAIGTPMMATLAAGENPPGTWQKVEGNPTPLSNAATTVARTGNAIRGGGQGEIVIDFTAGGVTDRSNIVEGSTVYISGSTLLNEGYYEVTETLGNTVTVLAMCGNNVGGGVLQPPEVGITLQAPTATAAAVPAAVDAGLKMTAVSGPIGRGINTAPLILGAAGTKQVSIAVPDNGHKYAIGDVIIFRNLATATVEYQGIRITQDKAYFIKGKTTNTIIFDADAVVEGVGIAVAGVGDFIGYDATYDAAGVVVAAAAAGAPSNSLGDGAYIDYVGAQFKGLGIDTNVDFFTKALDITYNGGKPEKNCSSGAVKADFMIETHVFDTFGREYPINIYFKHMSQKVVAVEIAFPPNAQGGYDIKGKPAGTGLIAYGNITFDDNGHMLSNPSLKEITLDWNNGVNTTTTITMNWGAVNGFDINNKASTQFGLTKLAGPNASKFVEPDGNAPGSVIGYKYSKSGVITALFSNGLTRDVYQVLVGMVANFDGLRHEGGGLYVAIPSESGQILLQIAGTAGAGSFVSGALESSTVDSSSEILDSTGIANLAKMLYHQIGTQKAVDDYALQHI